MRILLIFLLSIFTLPIFADEAKILPSEIGVVNSIQYIDVDNNEAGIQTKQLLDIKLITGEFKNETVQVENILTGNPYYDIKLKKNTRVILHAEDRGDGIEYSIEDIKRSGNLAWLSLIFCALLIYVGKKKGIFSLVSIALTVILIIKVLSPLILLGINPVLACFLICILSTAATMYLVGGFNKKSTSATLGACSSLIVAGILSYTVMFTAKLTGFAGENSMFLYSAHPELNFVSITIASMVLATLGAVMDVAMSIASTINEIYTVDSTKTIKELFKSGMNVGRDIIGTMANTLILVYMGGALPLILLSENVDWQKFMNLNMVVTEASSAIIGSIAIVICVPITAFISSLLLKKSNKNAEFNL